MLYGGFSTEQTGEQESSYTPEEALRDGSNAKGRARGAYAWPTKLLSEQNGEIKARTHALPTPLVKFREQDLT